MVLITHCGDNTGRLNEILNAAQKRFAIYGFEKVTVSEIAADLNMSKASIYYYFQDKEQLFGAVVEKEHSQFIANVEEQLADLTDPREMLMKYVEVNSLHFKTLMNLTRVKVLDYAKNENARRMIRQFRDTESKIIERILVKGREEGLFQVEDPAKIAELFLDLLKGLRKISIGIRDIVYVDDENFEGLMANVNCFVAIFIKGISA